MKITITLATVMFLAVCSLNAQVTPTGKSEFVALPPVQGRPGRMVTLTATLQEEVLDASTRRKYKQPLPGALVSFLVNPLATRGGYLPVGNLVTTRVNGTASARYRIPRKHPYPTQIPYLAVFAGDANHHGTKDTGKLRVK